MPFMSAKLLYTDRLFHHLQAREAVVQAAQAVRAVQVVQAVQAAAAAAVEEAHHSDNGKFQLYRFYTSMAYHTSLQPAV